MKKILVLILSLVLCVFSSYGQNDTLYNQNIDSLVLQINKIENNYDFLYCDYQINKLTLNITDFKNSIDITSNGITDNFYRNNFDVDLYLAYSYNYDASCELYNTYKEGYNKINTLVFSKILTSNFSELEIEVLTNGLSVIQKALNTAEASLKLYNISLTAYKSLNKVKKYN